MNYQFTDAQGFTYDLNVESLKNNHPFFQQNFIKEDGSDLIIGKEIFDNFTDEIGISGLGLYLYLSALATPNANFEFTISLKEMSKLTDTSIYTIKKYMSILTDAKFIEDFKDVSTKKTEPVIDIRVRKPNNQYITAPLTTMLFHHSDVDVTEGVRISRYILQFWTPFIGFEGLGMYGRLLSIALLSKGNHLTIEELGIREIAKMTGCSVNTARKHIQALEEYNLIVLSQQYDEKRNVHKTKYSLNPGARLDVEFAESLPKKLSILHEIWESGNSQWTLRKYPQKYVNECLVLNQTGGSSNIPLASHSGAFQMSVEDTEKHPYLKEFLNRIEIKIKTTYLEVDFWCETKELLSVLKDFNQIVVYHSERGKVSFTDLICEVIFQNYKGKYRDFIVEDTKEESLTWEYPDSKVMIMSMNWFLSLGYHIFKQNGFSTDKLNELANKHSFLFEVIQN